MLTRCLASFAAGIQKLVLAGCMGEAIEKTYELYPGILETKPNLLFMLKCRQFIEMVNGTDSQFRARRCSPKASGSSARHSPSMSPNSHRTLLSPKHSSSTSSTIVTSSGERRHLTATSPHSAAAAAAQSILQQHGEPMTHVHITPPSSKNSPPQSSSTSTSSYDFHHHQQHSREEEQMNSVNSVLNWQTPPPPSSPFITGSSKQAEDSMDTSENGDCDNSYGNGVSNGSSAAPNGVRSQANNSTQDYDMGIPVIL